MGAEDKHHYSVFTYMLEEINKMDELLYVHMVCPLAPAFVLPAQICPS